MADIARYHQGMTGLAFILCRCQPWRRELACIARYPRGMVDSHSYYAVANPGDELAYTERYHRGVVGRRHVVPLPITWENKRRRRSNTPHHHHRGIDDAVIFISVSTSSRIISWGGGGGFNCSFLFFLGGADVIVYRVLKYMYN